MGDRRSGRGRGFAAGRSVLVRDFLIFVVKLTIDGLKDFVLLPLASIAFVADLLVGKSGNPRLFYRVVRQAERFDRWLNLTGALDELERGETDDGLFGASTAGSDTLLGKMEEWVRGAENSDPAGGDPADDVSRGPGGEWGDGAAGSNEPDRIE